MRSQTNPLAKKLLEDEEEEEDLEICIYHSTGARGCVSLCSAEKPLELQLPDDLSYSDSWEELSARIEEVQHEMEDLYRPYNYGWFVFWLSYLFLWRQLMYLFLSTPYAIFFAPPFWVRSLVVLFVVILDLRCKRVEHQKIDEVFHPRVRALLDELQPRLQKETGYRVDLEADREGCYCLPWLVKPRQSFLRVTPLRHKSSGKVVVQAIPIYSTASSSSSAKGCVNFCSAENALELDLPNSLEEFSAAIEDPQPEAAEDRNNDAWYLFWLMIWLFL